jgi:hypothetical protein
LRSSFEKVLELSGRVGASDVEAAAADVDTWLALILVGNQIDGSKKVH